MEKLLAFLAIRAFTHNNQEAMLFYNVFFGEDTVEQPKVPIKVTPKSVIARKSIRGSVQTPEIEVPQPSSKKLELMESLKYLKSKKSKTNQDKQSISILEAVLKNMG